MKQSEIKMNLVLFRELLAKDQPIIRRLLQAMMNMECEDLVVGLVLGLRLANRVEQHNRIEATT